MKPNFYLIQTTSRFIFLGIFLCFQVICQSQSITENKCPKSEVEYYIPSSDLKDLFHDVQLANIFADSKTFADSKPLIPPDSILLLYNIEKPSPSFDLELFVKKCFQLPDIVNIEATDNNRTDLKNHLDSLWDQLLRDPDTSTSSSLLPLAYQYIVPGGRFREIYYWDSYFTMEGLAASGRLNIINDMLKNFTCLIKQFGYIPNGNRTYYIGRSQPPFFAEMVKLYMRETSNYNGLQYLPALEKEYQFWVESQRLRKLSDKPEYLNYYSDQNNTPRPESYKEDYYLAITLETWNRDKLYWNIRAACESGWDFSSRWMADGKSISTINTTDILPVDLNCLLYNLETTIAQLYKIAGNNAFYNIYLKKAEARKQLIISIFWNKKAGFFYDYNFKTKKQSTIESLAALYPLYFNIATAPMAEKVAEHLRKKFLKDGGLVTTLNNTGLQWDAPNGWAPLQWIAIIGLENYGIKGLADSIAQRWMTINEKVYYDTGKMMEKYNVSDTTLEAGGGEYPGQDGFGWTNGVYLGLLKKGYKTGR